LFSPISSPNANINTNLFNETKSTTVKPVTMEENGGLDEDYNANNFLSGNPNTDIDISNFLNSEEASNLLNPGEDMVLSAPDVQNY